MQKNDTPAGVAIDSTPLLDDAVWCLAHVWSEMNAIRARDGVPRMFDGTKSSVSQEWWDELMNRCEAVIVSHTGKPAHCNPVLYTSNAEAHVPSGAERKDVT